MKHKYDPEVDMHYVYLKRKRKKVKKSIHTQAVVDFDKKGNVVGLRSLA